MQKKLRNLAGIIANRRCVLFAGSGLTATSGGATWNELTDMLKSEFNYTSPLTDNFRIIGDICKTNGDERVYGKVKHRLERARVDKKLNSLMAMPWFATFTTNYDLAMENALRELQNAIVRVILTGNEFVLSGIQSEILCVKLMGSIDIPFGQQGSMVLTPGDLAIAREERGKIFDILASHANNLSFLFVGYSFDDGLFIEMLDRLERKIGRSEKVYYAIFLEDLSEEKKYILQQYNVECLTGDVFEIIENLAREVNLRDPSDFTKKRIPIGSNVVPINAPAIGQFLALHDPVLFEDLQEPVSSQSFFKGNIRSFMPFESGWHFERAQVDNIIKKTLSASVKDPNIIIAEGNPGTGRSFMLYSSVYKLIKEHGCLAIRIPNYSVKTIPTIEVLSVFLNEIEKTLNELDMGQIKSIIFFADFALDDSDILKYKKLARDVERYPTILMFEDVKSYQPEGYKIEADLDLSSSEKNDIVNYILETTRFHRFPEIREDEINDIVRQEKTFLPIMYRTIDPARRSIHRIIQEEFNSISNPIVKNCIMTCALSTSVDVELPLAVLKKVLSCFSNTNYSYGDTFQVAIIDSAAFVKTTNDARTNTLVSIYHHLIARYLLDLASAENIDDILLKIAQSIDLRSKIEAEYANTFFIKKGVNWQFRNFLNRPFSDEALEEALLVLKKRQAARPIIHHLARHIFKKNSEDPRILPFLQEALAEPKEVYAIEERKENVLNTLGRVMWDQQKGYLANRSLDDPKVQDILALLIRARAETPDNVHSYDVHARIIKDLWQNKKDDEKMALIHKAVDVITNGLEFCVDDLSNRERLNSLLIECLSEIDPSVAIQKAKALKNDKKDGSGYYTLALIEYYKNHNPKQAKIMLDESLSASQYPPSAIALKMKILLDSNDPDYDILLKLADKLSQAAEFQDTWESAYHKAVVYTINRKYENAVRLFSIANRMAPKFLQRKVQLFWMEAGHRKVQHGKIGRSLTATEGRIYSHTVSGWGDDIFFSPSNQKLRHLLQTGMFVEFELGFSPRGPMAFDIRPRTTKRNQVK